jgi:hypothetical protein
VSFERPTGTRCIEAVFRKPAQHDVVMDDHDRQMSPTLLLRLKAKGSPLPLYQYKLVQTDPSRPILQMSTSRDSEERAQPRQEDQEVENAETETKRRQRKHLAIGVSIAGLVAVTATVIGALVFRGASNATTAGTLEKIRRRGRLRCGIPTDVTLDDVGNGTSLEGFNVDLVRGRTLWRYGNRLA